MTINDYVCRSSQKLRRALFAAHEGKCFWTGQALDLDTFEVDHIRPVKNGGEDCLANFAPTALAVNRAKGYAMDCGLIERMLYLNKVAFAPKALVLLVNEPALIAKPHIARIKVSGLGVRGRPAINPDERRNRFISAAMNNAEYARFMANVKESGLTVSNYVRMRCIGDCEDEEDSKDNLLTSSKDSLILLTPGQ